MKKIAIITYHFYKTQTRGGEIYVTLLTDILKKIFKVTIITTQSKDHLTWKNEIIKRRDKYNGVKIIRFPVDFEVKPEKTTFLHNNLIKNKNHTLEEEKLWISSIGPYSTKLFNYLKENKTVYNFFIFVGYTNPITYFGLPLVKDRAFLIPLVHKEPRLYFKIFNNLFLQPAYILPNSQAEAKIIKKRFPFHSPMHILGINMGEIKKPSNIDIKEKFHLENPYIIFIGRTEPYKGIYELINFFSLFIKQNPIKLDLVIIGEKIFPIKTNKNIKYLGVVSQEEKIALIKNSSFLINPSWYESLSLTLLEAWQQEKPVIVNAACPVLKDQVIRSSGGLYYETAQEFENTIKKLLTNKKLSKTLGNNGYLFYKKNYSTQVIELKLKKLINKF